MFVLNGYVTMLLHHSGLDDESGIVYIQHACTTGISLQWRHNERDFKLPASRLFAQPLFSGADQRKH